MEALKGLYHADKLDEQSFIDNFTIRLKEFKQIMDNLKQQKQKPLQHFLITGKRGMGKSTLLRRIFIEAAKLPLNEKILAVRLGQEQYRLSRLFKLWEQVIEYLGNNDSKLLEQKKAIENSKQYEENLVHIINDYLSQTGKTLLLLIDNFDQFIEKIPLKDQHALREALIMYPIQIIGNTVFYNEHFVDYGKPFFDFFKPIRLGNLDKDEAEEFIKLRAAGENIENFEEIFEKQKGKISTLRILSGGVPRTLLILLSIISKKNTGDAVDYLHEMIEQVTPLYQDRMKSLSPQQQEIMHHLAMHWDRVPVKELATEMRVPSKSISAQLAQLEKSGYIRKEDIPGRNHYYEIDERFFNIWLLMSEALPYDTKRVIWLTKWLDAFYSNDELKDFAMFCQNGLKEAKPANRFLLAQALSESAKLGDDYKKKLLQQTEHDLKEKMPEVKIWAEDQNKRLTEKEIQLRDEIDELFDKLRFEEAMDKLNSLEKLNESLALFGKGIVFDNLKNFTTAESYYKNAAEKGHVRALNNLGLLYKNERKDLAGAEKYFLMAADNGDSGAMFNLGLLYKNEKKDLASAEKYYQMAAEIGDSDAMNNLGILYQNIKKDIASAEKYYQMAADKGNSGAMYNLGILYRNEKDDIASAEKYYKMAANKGNLGAMFNLGILYSNEKYDIASAEKYYKMAVEKGDSDAMFNLGILYENEKKDIASAEKYYQMAVEIGNSDAMFNLGILYENEKKDIAGAEKYYQMAVEKGDSDAMFNLGILYENEKKDIASAEKYYQMAAEIGDSDAMNSLGILYQNIKKDIASAEKYYQMAADKGLSGAMFNLGILYENERKDIAIAEKYYKMAAEIGDSYAMFNLGILYENEKKDIAGAEKYYQMAAEKGHVSAMATLASLYFVTNQTFQKVNADKLSKRAIESEGNKSMIRIIIRIGILLWNEKVKEAELLMVEILKYSENTDGKMKLISDILQYFLVFRQKQFLFKTFKSNEQLIDQYKPVYYALMHEMQDEYPKEFLKMTEELKEPVEAILKFVKKEQERLGLS